ncbi:MAG: nucleotidyltransferase [Chryseobacterium sp.]|nr:nucleotidyltransferase [Chryseobacterium sp.]
MARTIDQISDTIIGKVQAEPLLAGLNSTSKTSIWRLFIYCVAFGIWMLELLFDTHKAEIDTALANQKKGSELWYRNMALAFQYGFALIPDTDQFDNMNYTEDQISASKIIKYAAVTPSETESRLIVKVATENSDGILSPIDDTQKTAFDFYFSEINYAGVKYTVINYAPDRLKLVLTIKVDPKVIDLTGTKILMSAIDVGSKPVEEALKEFMKELPFDGKLVLNALVDKLQKVQGVVNPVLDSAMTSWIDPSVGGYGALQVIYDEVLPVSGYFTWSLDDVEFQTDIRYVV